MIVCRLPLLDLPSSCPDCLYSERKGWRYLCRLTGEFLFDTPDDQRNDACPLMEIPERKPRYDDRIKTMVWEEESE